MITFTGGKWAFGVMVAVMAVAAGRQAAATVYDSTNSGNWITSTVWNPNGVPVTGDQANIVGGYTVTIDGTTQVAGSAWMGYVGKNSGTLILTNNATLTATINVGANNGSYPGYLYVDGSTIVGTTLTLKGDGSVVKLDNKSTVTASGAVGLSSVGSWLIITNGSSFIAASAQSSISGASNCVLHVGGKSGSSRAVWSGGAQIFTVSGDSNGIIVDEGGTATNRVQFSGSNGYLTITNGGQCTLGNGVQSSGTGNRVTVAGTDSSGIPSLLNGNAKAYSLGFAPAASGNGLLINKGGCVSNCSGMVVGTDVNCSNNFIRVSGGGVLEQSPITVGANASTSVGNVVSNGPGGVLQFTADTPTLTVNNPSNDLSKGNAFIITNGIVSFKGTTVSLTNNWAGSLAPSNNITWLGANTLRLDGAKGTAREAYTFYYNNAPTNYAGLEMYNSASLVSNQAVIIGDSAHSYGGSLVVSNGTFSIRGVVTNYSPNVILANVTSLVASNGIVWGDGSAATTTPGTVTFDTITTNRLDSGTVAWIQSATTATQVVSGVVLGAGGLRKGGPGVLILSGNNKYAGGTTVSNGTLQVSGVITGNVSVASAATLSVAGSVTGAVSVASGGFLSGTGTVVGAMTNAGVIYAVVTNATPPVLNITGSLTLQAGSQLVLAGDSTNYLANNSSSTLTIIHASGGLNGTTFTTDNVPEGWRLSYDNVGGYVRLQPGYPGTMILFQ